MFYFAYYNRQADKGGFFLHPTDTKVLFDIPFRNVTLAEALALLRQYLADGATRIVVTPNSEIVYECTRDRAAKDAVLSADLILPDGAGVVLASKILGCPLKGKVAGVDIAHALPAILEAEGKRLFLYGGKPGVADLAAKNLQTAHPDLCIAGTLDGYGKSDEAAVEAINESGADVVYVCLGAPRQELFMQQYRGDIRAALLLGLGGSVDILAGVSKRAPDIFVRLGLEWFYRLLKEPSRIGRMTRLPRFLGKAIVTRLSHGKPDE